MASTPPEPAQTTDVPPPIYYAIEQTVAQDDFLRVIRTSTLGDRRPAADEARMDRMRVNSNLWAVARVDDAHGEIVGLARCLTDFDYACYLSDLAVCQTYQRRGIGQRLVQLVRDHLGPQVAVLLLSAPNSVPFYERIGMPRLKPDAFCYPRER